MKLYKPTYTRKGETRESTVWWVRFRCNGKDVRRSTGMRDRTAAMTKVAEIVKAEELRAAGVAVPEVTHAPLQDLVVEYIQDMERRRLTPSHVSMTRGYLERTLGPFQGCAQVTTQALRTQLGALRCSAFYRNRHLAAVRTFFRWLGNRWPYDPTVGIQPSQAEDFREKGVFTLAELQALLHEPSIYEKRREVYLVAATTGLRKAELRRVRGEHVQGEVLRLPSQLTKNRRPAAIPLLPPLAKALAGRKGKLFSPPDHRTWCKDLQRAELPRLDPRGNVRSFHSLRVSLATILSQENVPLTLAQRILRHGDPRLTANVYVKHGLDQQRDALGVLGALLGAQSVVTCPSVSQDSTPQNPEGLPGKELVPLTALSGCQECTPSQSLWPQGVTSEIKECLAQCLALLSNRPKGLDPGWDLAAEEAVRHGRQVLRQPDPA